MDKCKLCLVESSHSVGLMVLPTTITGCPRDCQNRNSPGFPAKTEGHADVDAGQARHMDGMFIHQPLRRSVFALLSGIIEGCLPTEMCCHPGIGSLPNDAALIALWSGEIHVITNLTTDPKIDNEQSRLSSQAVNEAIHTLDREIVDAQREKQGGDLRFTEQFTEDMTLRVVGADVNGSLLSLIFE
jgi:hypothetical protein